VGGAIILPQGGGARGYHRKWQAAGLALAVVPVPIIAEIGVAAPIIGAEPLVAGRIVAVVGAAGCASVVGTAVAAIASVELAAQERAGGETEEAES
jgi:hypothetical protein